MKDPNLCMVPACEKKVAFNGICKSCHGIALEFIKAKETTWEELELNGLARLNGRPMEAAFAKMKQKPLRPAQVNAEIESLKAEMKQLKAKLALVCDKSFGEPFLDERT